MRAFVIANGKTGESLAKNTQEKECDCTLSSKEAILNFDFKKVSMESPFNNLAKKKPSNEASEYAIINGITPFSPHMYPVNKAKKVVGLKARPMISTAKIQKTSSSKPCKE